MSRSCVASTTSRRSRAQIDAIKDELYAACEAEQPLTIRHAFYLIANGYGQLIEKTEAEYQRTVVRLMGQLRREGRIPWSWIADNTRFMRKPRTYSGIESAIQRTAETYRRSMWDNQQSYVEVWCEKDAITGVVIDITNPFDVPLMICRGYPSLTFIQSAAENIVEVGKPTKIIYLGDWDPSGRDIPRFVERQIREFAPSHNIEFNRLAVTPIQIELFDLPTRPTKRSDSRAKDFDGASVDIDAIPPSILRKLVDDAINREIDAHTWNKLVEVEAQEKEHLTRMTKLLTTGGK